MHKSKIVDILCCTTQYYLAYYTVLLRSVAENLAADTSLRVHIMYCDYNKMPEKTWKHYIEVARNSFDDLNVELIFYDVTDKMGMFKNQNMGMWGNAISVTHYMYLLAPIILNDVSKVIYMDGDMICNCDLSKVFNKPMKNKAIALTEHSRGDITSEKELGYDSNNTGFLMMNLDIWREHNILADIIKFGESIIKTSFCDQALIYFYFTKKHPNLKMLLKAEYNMFPTVCSDVLIKDIKVLHFTAFQDAKPWTYIFSDKYRGGDIWWKYARKTGFYELLLFNVLGITNIIDKIQSIQKPIPKFFGRIISCFIPTKHLRHKFKDKYVKNI